MAILKSCINIGKNNSFNTISVIRSIQTTSSNNYLLNRNSSPSSTISSSSSSSSNNDTFVNSNATITNGNGNGNNNQFALFTSAVENPPSTAKVVICGGGLFGTSIAYHLAELGFKDVVLVTRNKIGSGTTYYTSGVLGQVKLNTSETLLSKYSSNLYEKLQKDGHQIKYVKCGSLGLATTRDRWHTVQRQCAEAKTRGIECHLLSAEECYDKFPLIRYDDLEGGIWLPQDGHVSPKDLLQTFASEATKNGILIVENCEVNQVLLKSTRGGQYHKIRGVETTKGTIECDVFVNCAGIRARELGKLSNPRVKVPVHSCEHYYCITKPFGINTFAPVIRDYDGCIYMRYNEGGGLLFGGFEKEAKPIFHESSPKDFECQTLNPDFDHFYTLLKSFINRVPSAVDAEVDQIVNGPESFTPDTRMIMGESAEVDGYFVAAGSNADTASLAGGVGRHIAEMIAFGETDTQLWPVDVRRFVKLHNNRKFLRDRVKETVGKQYSLKYPTYGMSLYRTGRKLRTSPLYTRMLTYGAVYGEILGYERPLWFDNGSSKEYYIEDAGKGSFGKPSWLEAVRDEYMACRRGVAVMDMSSFTKFELKSAGREVIDFLQYICSNDVDSPVGHVIHTGMQNHKGGYENDCSVVKLENNCYMIISPVTQQTRNMKWLSEHFPEDGSVLMSDITSLYAAINLVGPKAVELLGELTDESLSTTDFQQFTCKEIDIGYASGIKAMRLTHTGEDGFMLYVPTEYALHVYDTLMEKGKNYGIINAGYFALRALRIEKMFAFWGQDLDKNTTPYECGRDFRVKLDRKDFIGKMALLKLKSEQTKRRFVQLVLEDHDLYANWPWGGEPIFRNGKFCGYTTSTTYGFTLEKQVCLGFVHNFDEKTGEKLPVTIDYLTKNATYEVDIASKRYRAKIHVYPPNLNLNIRH